MLYTSYNKNSCYIQYTSFFTTDGLWNCSSMAIKKILWTVTFLKTIFCTEFDILWYFFHLAGISNVSLLVPPIVQSLRKLYPSFPHQHSLTYEYTSDLVIENIKFQCIINQNQKHITVSLIQSVACCLYNCLWFSHISSIRDNCRETYSKFLLDD